MKPEKFPDSDFQKITNKPDETMLSEEMASLAGYVGYYTYQRQLWNEVVANFKYQIDCREADAAFDIREAATATATKLTEGSVKEGVARDEQLRKLNRALLEASSQMGRYQTAINVFDTRAKMLQSMGSNKRSELGNVAAVNGNYHSGGIVYPTSGMAPPSPWTTATVTSDKIVSGSITTDKISMSKELEAALTGLNNAKAEKMDDERRAKIQAMLAGKSSSDRV
jgi:hypothetical protein